MTKNTTYPDLKKLVYSFGLKWIFCTTRTGKRISCNRAHRQELLKHNLKKILRVLRVVAVGSFGLEVLIEVMIKYLILLLQRLFVGGNSNTGDPSYVDPFILVRTRCCAYKHCAG